MPTDSDASTLSHSGYAMVSEPLWDAGVAKLSSDAVCTVPDAWDHALSQPASYELHAWHAAVSQPANRCLHTGDATMSKSGYRAVHTRNTTVSEFGFARLHSGNAAVP